LRPIIIITILLFSVSAYSQRLIGGPCSYREYPGSCTVTGEDEGKAVYTFEGDVEGRQVKLGGNKSDEEMAPGSQVDCMLMFIREGTCTPCLLSLGSCGKEAWDLYRDIGKSSKSADPAGPENGGSCTLMAQ
jgi:hypothetical protein